MSNSIIVIGGGVAGLSTSFTLLKQGYAVTLIEQGQVGKESSWAGGGILSPLLPWNYPAAVTAVSLISMSHYAEWVNLIETLSSHRTEYWRCGMRVLEVSCAEKALSWCNLHSFSVLSNITDSGDSLWLPDIAQVRNPYLITALREAIVKLGGVIRPHCAVEAATTQNHRVLAVQTTQGTFTADRFVLATGAWAGIGLPGLLGVPNVRPIRGQMLLFNLEPGVLDTILYRDGLYLIPRRDGHVLVGSTIEDVGFDKSTDTATRQSLHAAAAKLFPILESIQPIKHWAGLRPGSPDNIPVIDRHPDFENLYINTGHFRYGVTMAPASAELLVDLMEGKTPALDPTPYSWNAALERSWNQTE